jgi:hypothetical protein
MEQKYIDISIYFLFMLPIYASTIYYFLLDKKKNEH